MPAVDRKSAFNLKYSRPSKQRPDGTCLRMISGTAWNEAVDVETVANLCRDFKQMPTLLKNGIQHANSIPLEMQQHDDFTGE